MKVLAIVGSPRKRGNTHRVVEQIRERLMEYNPEMDFEVLFLGECDLRMCIGCFACIAHGEDKCPLRDDRKAIEDRMTQADGILYAAPTYATGVPALMKNFIDRFAYTCHRPLFFDKVFLAVTTIGGVKGMKPTLGQLSVLCAGGRLAAKLGVAMPPIAMAGLQQKADRDIEKASAAFYRALAKKEKKLPGLADWAWFHSFKALCGYPSYQKACPADHRYYSQRPQYFYPLAGHPLRRLLGRAFGGIMRFSFGFLIKKD